MKDMHCDSLTKATQSHTHAHACMHTCMHTHTCVHAYAHLHVYLNTDLYTCMHIYMYAHHTCILIYTCMCTHTKKFQVVLGLTLKKSLEILVKKYRISLSSQVETSALKQKEQSHRKRQTHLTTQIISACKNASGGTNWKGKM